MKCHIADECAIAEAIGAHCTCDKICAYAPTYESWRISYQSSEQAARAAFEESSRLREAMQWWMRQYSSDDCDDMCKWVEESHDRFSAALKAHQ